MPKPKTKTNRIKKTSAPQKPRRWLRPLLIAQAFLIVPLLIWMYVESRVVRLMISDVPLHDLPPEFDGVTVLFVSDLHMAAYASPEATMDLMRALQEAKPDLLLLGGDYTHTALIGGDAAELRRRERFFELMAEFEAPLGKYAVAGNHDVSLDKDAGSSLAEAMEKGGVTLLRNEVVRIEKDGAHLTLAGLDDWSRGVRDPAVLAGQIRSEECAIVLSHNPDALPRLNTHQASNGGQWIDLMLSGHTHGGQMTMFGLYNIYNPSIYGDRFLSGWKMEDGVKLLVSNGVGSVVVPFRLLAPAQAHLLTLRRGGEDDIS